MYWTCSPSRTHWQFLNLTKNNEKHEKDMYQYLAHFAPFITGKNHVILRMVLPFLG